MKQQVLTDRQQERENAFEEVDVTRGLISLILSDRKRGASCSINFTEKKNSCVLTELAYYLNMIQSLAGT